MPARFRAWEHIRRPAEFRRVYDRKRSVSDERLIIYACENGLPYARIGLSVSRKAGPAVVRSRIRRIFREAFRLVKADLPTGIDLVLIPRGTARPTLAEMRQSLCTLVPQIAKRLNREAKPL